MNTRALLPAWLLANAASVSAQTIPLELPAPAADDRVDAAPQDETSGIRQIIVTAQKRAEDAQDVPISIQAFSGEDLSAKGIADPAALQTYTPGLIYDSLGAFNIIYIRGVGTDAFIPSADLSVATYVDGVYFPFARSLAQAFGKIERIEILKGPQGTLFGRNSTGGAINIVTPDPGQDTTGSAQVSYARFDDFQSKAYVSGPLADSLSVGLGVLYNHKDDYYRLTGDAAADGNDLQAYQDKGANLKIRWVPGDFVDATATGYRFETRGVGTSLFVLERAAPLLGTALQLEPTTEPYKSSSEHAKADFVLSAGTLTLNVHPGSFDIKSISAYQESKAQGLIDFDGTASEIAIQSTYYADTPGHRKTQFSRAFTQEVQLLSNDESWGADWMKWILGGYYIRSTSGFNPVAFNVAGLDDILTGDVLGAVPGNALGAIRDRLDALGLPSVGFNLSIYGFIGAESWAAFTQTTIEPIERVSVTLGMRYQFERRHVYNVRTDAVLLPSQQTVTVFPVGGGDRPVQRLREDHLAPKVAIQYRLADDVNVYGSWSVGYKSGSFNMVNLNAPPGEIKPEKVESFEAGLKSTLFANHLRMNAALFRNRIDDLQVQVVSLASGGVLSFENAGKATIDGAEIEVEWAATSQLTLTFDRRRRDRGRMGRDVAADADL
ncbi:MAG TPA: TonB-dependent receptor, partial [Nevskiaceae bacterium]|nr:TonB-dependent receptor [Nevskiaceae bacterium]